MLVNTHKLKPRLLLFLLTIVIISPTQAQPWSLKQCIDTAQVKNKMLQISENNISIGEQRHKEAVAGLIPKVNINGDYKYYYDLPYQLMPLSTFNASAPTGQFKEAQFGVPHNINLNVQFTMPLFNAQILGGMETTKIGTDLSKLQRQKTEEQVFFDISNLYYNVQILQKQVVFIDSNLVNTKKLLQNMQLLKEQLMVKSTDVTKIQLQKAQLQTQREIVENKLLQLMNALKFSMGIPISKDIEIDPGIEFKNRSEYANQASVDIRLVETQNRFLKSELSTLKNSRLPSLSLYGTYGQTGFGYDVKPNDFLKFFAVSFVGVQLNYPLFNGTVTQRKMNQKKLEISNNNLQLSLATEQNTMLIENAKRTKITAQLIVENTLAQIKLAQTVYEQTILQQKQGTSNLTDVLLADNTLRESQQNYLSAIVELLKAELELKKLTGNLSN
ncbi:MAG: TolC family protein [Paludibacter sp.]|nr:TolC family protein [Paludibacter sp.]